MVFGEKIGPVMLKSHDKERGYWTFSFFFIAMFFLLRPLFSLQIALDYGIGGLKFSELFGIFSSFILFLVVFLNLKHFNIEFPSFLLACFILYVLLTFLWTGSIRNSFRFVLPFFGYFAVRLYLTNSNQIMHFLLIGIISFIAPILLSTLLILTGKTVASEIYFTGLVRYEGLFGGPHTLAHWMYIFLFMMALYFLGHKTRENNRPLFHYFLFFVAMCALYNIYKSGTRTVILGTALTFILYLIFNKKYLIIFIILLIFLYNLILSETVEILFFDVVQPLSGLRTTEKMGSGRLGIWENILGVFLNSPLEWQFLGHGISNITESTGGSHNDLITLVISLGYIGITLYVLMYLAFCYNIFKSNKPYKYKTLFLSMLIAVMAMNFGSNSYITRFGLNQYLMIFLGMYSYLESEP